MTIARMNELYEKGRYSPANYYLGLLSLLKADAGANLATVMGMAPETLLGTILDLAARHHESSDRTPDDQECGITADILAWGKSRGRATVPPTATASGLSSG